MRGPALAHIAMVALPLHALAAWLCGLASPGYSHREHPLALLGATGAPEAAWFNAFGFVLPGLLAALAMWRERATMPADAGWPRRIAARLGMLGGIAFAGQGVFPLDPADIGAPANALHALAWTLWWIATAASAVAFARAAPTSRMRRASFAIAILVPAFALVHWAGALAAVAPRASFLVWLAWAAALPRLNRDAA